MIKFYIMLSQYHNFVDLKEPVQFVPYVMSDGYVEMLYDTDDVEINIYRTHATIELRKRGLKAWLKRKFSRKKN